jgi:hypothetical protein
MKILFDLSNEKLKPQKKKKKSRLLQIFWSSPSLPSLF